jgi:hypothetical protein
MYNNILKTHIYLIDQDKLFFIFYESFIDFRLPKGESQWQ